MNKIEIGQLIESRRKSLGVSQRELADISGLSVMTIVNIESGKGNPTIDVLENVLDKLGLTLEIVAIKKDR